ncbi:MAG TPA: GatB/YqeY domain-containing protein [Gammaproteobacteria bacterium]|nr:GatB/YqeY domain-containing protein [Gammaproteobacteria bacterium]
MSLKAQLQDDMKAAMRAGDKPRLGVIRGIQAAIKQREIDERVELDDAQVLAILEKLAKQRNESISQFEAGNRPDLAKVEAAELAIIKTYLPEPLSDAELDTIIDAAFDATSASSMKDMGKVMALVKEQAAGRADMAAVSKKIKARLS